MRKSSLGAGLALAMAAMGAPAFGVRADGGGEGSLPVIRPVMTLRPMAGAPNEYEMLVYGDIGESWWGESVTALAVVQQLQALDAGVTQINVRINSYGGSVSDGIAIYYALKRHSAKKVVTIDGVAMSSASLIAMAGDEIQMPETSLLMIHAPWGFAQGNANDMRTMADVLDTYADAMANAYAAKSGKSKTDALALLKDGQDHYYTGEDAVAEGFADSVISLVDEPATDDTSTQAAAGVNRLLAKASDKVRQLAVTAAARRPFALPEAAAPRLRVPAGIDFPQLQTALASADGQRALVTALTTAASATDEELTMKIRKLFGAMAALRDPARDPGDGGNAGGGNAPAQASAEQVHAALRTRNEDIRAVLEPYMSREGVNALYVSALADPAITVDGVRAQLLPILGNGAQPAGGATHVEMGADERDKRREAAQNVLMARYGLINGAQADSARQGNPFARATLLGIAEDMLVHAGVNTRTMGREELARRVLAGGQTTSDFPILLENVLHKALVGGYTLKPFTWTRFCTTGTLVDYRPHGRYHLSSFSDLKPVNERGEYETGVLGDAEKEMIQGARKGRILELTPEVLINDDLGALVRLSGALGQAAGRTIEKDVYGLLALNGGLGPVMSDGLTLFHADHGNVASGAGNVGAPSVALIDAGRQAMAAQMEPGGNDFLDIDPVLWLGPLTLGGSVRVINRAEYDPDTPNKLQRPNMVANIFRDVIDTPRLQGAAWNMFADPALEPVFEVAFLDGVQTPTLDQEINFRTDGIAWKAAHRYGVAAVGWRGAFRNPGQ